MVVTDDLASPLLSQPPEMLPAPESGAGGSLASAEVMKTCSGVTTGPEVLLEPARMEEKASHVEDASSEEASMLPSHKPTQKVLRAYSVFIRSI